MIGAALATLCSYFISSIITLILANKTKLIRYNYERMYSYIIVFFMFSISFNSFTFLSPLKSFLAKVLVFLSILLYLSSIYQKELKFAYKSIKAKFKNNK